MPAELRLNRWPIDEAKDVPRDASICDERRVVGVHVSHAVALGIPRG
jgi:hypothetical protein